MDEQQWVKAFRARLKEVVDGFASVNALAKQVGRSEGTLRNWLAGPSLPNVWDIARICEATRTSVTWLVQARGDRSEKPALREPGATYTVAEPAEDHALLQATIEAANEELRTAGRDLGPAKHAELIVTLYDIFRARGDVDRATVTRLIRLTS